MARLGGYLASTQQARQAAVAATAVALVVPWLFQRAGSDPAFGSGPLATVLQDIFTIAIYFAVATPLPEHRARAPPASAAATARSAEKPAIAFANGGRRVVGGSTAAQSTEHLPQPPVPDHQTPVLEHLSQWACARIVGMGETVAPDSASAHR